MYNIRFFLALLSQTLICYAVTSVSKKKRHVWMLTSLWLIILNALKFETMFTTLTSALDVDESKVHDFLVIFAWCMLRNISFNLERIASKKEHSLLNCLGYVFYLPTFHCGPSILYTRYAHMLNYLKNEESSSLKGRLRILTMQLSKFGLYFLIKELALHFFYVYHIAMSVDLKALNSFAMFGIGLIHGQFFNMKYVIQYGIPIALGEFEHVPMPNNPKCICRVHRYSDMW
jgi:hypothetical protein